MYISIVTGCPDFDGIELVFFVAAYTGLCFGFVLKTVLMIPRCFSCCWAVPAQVKAFSDSFHAASQASRIRLRKNLGRGQNWSCWPQLTEGVFHMYDIVFNNKSWEKKEEGVNISSYGLYLSK